MTRSRRSPRSSTDAGITVLEGNGVVLDCAGGRLGVAGVKGFGGGFAGRVRQRRSASRR